MQDEIARLKAQVRKLKNKIRDKDVALDRSMALTASLARENEKLKEELFRLVSNGCEIEHLSEKREQVNVDLE